MSNKQNDIYEENKREFLEEEIMESNLSLEEREEVLKELDIEECRICKKVLKNTRYSACPECALEHIDEVPENLLTD